MMAAFILNLMSKMSKLQSIIKTLLLAPLVRCLYSKQRNLKIQLKNGFKKRP